MGISDELVLVNEHTVSSEHVSDELMLVLDLVKPQGISDELVLEIDYQALPLLTGEQIMAGSISASKLMALGFKLVSFGGRNGAGPCSCPGVVEGDRIVGVARTDAASTPGTAAKALFETTVTFVDAIQQTSVADLSGQVFTALVFPREA